MADREPKYENKTVRVVRGMEARTISKWERDGWELVGQSDERLFRTKLDFRRVKSIKRLYPVLLALGLFIVAAGGIALLASLPRTDPQESVESPTVATSATTAPTPSPAEETLSAAPSEATEVTEQEVVDVFWAFFRERAESGVMVGKAVTDVDFSDGIVTVIFTPAAAGVDQQTFDALNAFDNLAYFASTPVAFNDEVGNRLRPVINAIETVRFDGEPLGTISRAEILALNGLDQ